MIWLIVCRPIDNVVPDSVRMRAVLKRLLRSHGMKALEVTCGDVQAMKRINAILSTPQANELNVRETAA